MTLNHVYILQTNVQLYIINEDLICLLKNNILGCKESKYFTNHQRPKCKQPYIHQKINVNNHTFIWNKK